jgi:hypothetical protein
MVGMHLRPIGGDGCAVDVCDPHRSALYRSLAKISIAERRGIAIGALRFRFIPGIPLHPFPIFRGWVADS